MSLRPALAIVAPALALIAAWLWIAPGLAARVAGGAGAWSEALFTLLVFAPLLGLAVVGRLVSDRSTGPPAPPRDRRIARAAAQGAAVGLVGILLATGYAALAGTLRHGSDTASLALLAGLPVVALQVAAEEALFRGWLQPVLARATGAPIAIAAIALAFAALHLLGGARDPLALLNLLLGGALFGLLAARGGGMAAAFGAHFAWNAVEQLGLGLDPNPGVGAFGALVDLDLVGAARWGGSGEGLNASLAMTIALGAVLAPLVMWRSGGVRGEAVRRVSAGV